MKTESTDVKKSQLTKNEQGKNGEHLADTLLAKLCDTITGMELPLPEDLRGTLAENPDGAHYRKRNAAKMKGMVWHQALAWQTVEQIAAYHTGPDCHIKKGGVESIAYSIAVRRNGQIVITNDFEKAVWAQGTRKRKGDENSQFLAVLFEGHFTSAHQVDTRAGEPTAAQMLAGMTLWLAAKQLWNWNDDGLYGHHHFGKKYCPGDTLETIVESVRANHDARIRNRQHALRLLGFYRGEIDGLWGRNSKIALREFQKSRGLAVDGIWGAQTENTIRGELK